MGTNSPYSLVLVDGSSYLYRAFYALPPLTNRRGEPTGAVFGVSNMIKRLLKDYPSEYFAVVFDARGPTFRDKLFSAYKATRSPTPPDITAQFPILKKLMEALGLPVIQIEGVEADDVIGTLAISAKKKNLPVLISTGDKDIAQLVQPGITLINTMNQTLLDREGVIQKFGIPPERIIDYLALIGDTVDNIPGIPKVGPKTAVKWLTQYGSLDEIMQHSPEITGAVGESLRSHLDTLDLSRQLATLKLDVEMPFSIEDLKPTSPIKTELRELLEQLEFHRWLKDLDAEISLSSPSLLHSQHKLSEKNNYKTITTTEEFGSWLERIHQAEVFAFDTETTSLNTMNAKLVGISLAIQPHEAVYIPLGHSQLTTQLSEKYVLEKLKPLLESSKSQLIGHNVKYDLEVLANYDIYPTHIASDTMLESYVLNSAASRHNLDTLALKYLQHSTIHYEDVTGKGTKQIPFADVDIAAATEYSCEDADICLRLHHYFEPQFHTYPQSKKLLEALEIPLIFVLARIERKGVLIDVAKLSEQSQQLTSRINEIAKEAYLLAGCEFNLSSPKQLQTLLYDQLKLPILEKTPKGQPSTAESALQELAVEYPLPRLILEHRSLSKLKSTYTDALPRQINAKTGRVHTSYNQAVTVTGRLSSTDPNLQNIPIRTEAGRAIRKAFIAPPGYKIAAFDYSQIELRIMAHLSNDSDLLGAFVDGIDIHRATAAEVFGTTAEKVTHEQRRNAKAINFGLIYGMSAYGLSRQLGIETSMAKFYIDRYFHRYPGVKKYMEETRQRAHEQGYVETILGRRLYLPDINSRQAMRVRAMERAAINAPMQGTAADIIKRAMIDVDDWLKTSRLDAAMIMQVHDELVFEVAESAVDDLIPNILRLMSGAAQLAVPLVVDYGVGMNWDEAH